MTCSTRSWRPASPRATRRPRPTIFQSCRCCTSTGSTRTGRGGDELLRHGHVAHAGLTGRRFGNFDVALQACKDGQGIAVGWHRMVEGLVASGELVRFTALSMPAPGAYYLTWNANLSLKGQAAEFREWLVIEAQGAGLTA